MTAWTTNTDVGTPYPFLAQERKCWATNTTRLAEKPMATQLYSPNMSLRENRTEELLRKQDLAIYG